MPLRLEPPLEHGLPVDPAPDPPAGAHTPAGLAFKSLAGQAEQLERTVLVRPVHEPDLTPGRPGPASAGGRLPGRADHRWSNGGGSGTLSAVRPLVPLVIVALGAGCTRAPRDPDPPTAGVDWLAPVEWDDHAVLLGVSGAAMRGSNELWVAPERTGQLLRVSWDGRRLGPPQAVPVKALPEGMDIEGLAFLDGEHLVLATEVQSERDTDEVLLAAIENEQVRVEGRLKLSYARFGLRAEKNRGLEGVCVASGHIVAASEAVRAVDGVREAPLGVWSPDESGLGPARGAWLRLTSDEGKLSALTCASGPSGLEVHAIERHFGTMRVVSFRVPLPLPETPPRLEASVVADMGPVLAPNVPNLEGLARLSDDRWLLVSDNHFGRRTGPTEAFVMEAPGPLR